MKQLLYVNEASVKQAVKELCSGLAVPMRIYLDLDGDLSVLNWQEIAPEGVLVATEKMNWTDLAGADPTNEDDIEAAITYYLRDFNAQAHLTEWSESNREYEFKLKDDGLLLNVEIFTDLSMEGATLRVKDPYHKIQPLWNEACKVANICEHHPYRLSYDLPCGVWLQCLDGDDEVVDIECLHLVFDLCDGKLVGAAIEFYVDCYSSILCETERFNEADLQ